MIQNVYCMSLTADTNGYAFRHRQLRISYINIPADNNKPTQNIAIREKQNTNV